MTTDSTRHSLFCSISAFRIILSISLNANFTHIRKGAYYSQSIILVIYHVFYGNGLLHEDVDRVHSLVRYTRFCYNFY